MKDELAERKRQRQKDRRIRDARRGRLGTGRFETIVKELAAVTRLAFEAGAIASKFGLEGPLRHEIRADLCLQGWRWRDADEIAREMMEETFRVMRVARPDWYEGQLEWTVHAGTLIERTRCVHCHGQLPEGHWKFCGALCQSASFRRLSRLRAANEDEAVRIATRLI